MTEPLSVTHPELAAEAHGWDPVVLTPGSNKKVSWRCKDGHIWDATVNNRTFNGRGCPFCSGRRKVSGVNDLPTTHPELAAQAVGWDPANYAAGSHDIMQWCCPKGHEWKAQIKSRALNARGCPVCANRTVQIGFNDIATTHPELAAQAFGWDPETLTAGSNKKVQWECQEGHLWLAQLNKRSGKGSGCPVCANRTVQIGFNDLGTTHPELTVQAVGWDPETLTAGSNKKVQWECQEGHLWLATVYDRAIDRTGCPSCSGRVVITGVNDLATMNPLLASEAFGWDPSNYKEFSNVKVSWRCALGHNWTESIINRSKGNGCPFCSNHQILIGFNDLAATHPELAAQAVGWDPETIVAGTHQKLRWKCEMGHEWVSQVQSRSFRGLGCPSCAVTGFDPNKKAWLYFLEHELWGLLQIGISNVIEQRLSVHQASGWRLLDLRGPMMGDLTFQWEHDILHALRQRSVNLGPEHIAGKFSGYTEAWVQEEFPAKTMKELMDLVHQDENLPERQKSP